MGFACMMDAQVGRENLVASLAQPEQNKTQTLTARWRSIRFLVDGLTSKKKLKQADPSQISAKMYRHLVAFSYFRRGRYERKVPVGGGSKNRPRAKK
jgi:hypothetical protein